MKLGEMKKIKINLALIISGITILILISLVRTLISPIVSILFFVLEILSLGSIIFGLVNFTKMSLWLKILVSVIIAVILFYSILVISFVYMPH